MIKIDEDISVEEFEAQTGIRLDKRKVSLPVEINALGVYIAVVDLHKEVKANLEKIVENRGLENLIKEIKVPVETVIHKDGEKEKVEEVKIFPSYVFIKMVYSDNTWHVIRNVRGVAGFVGASGNDPIPLTDDEVYEMGVEKREIVVNYVVGDTVRILDGPLSSFTGTVESIEVEKNAVSVIVSMFGRETPVEFELDQVEVISQ